MMMMLLIVRGVCQCVTQGAMTTAALLGSHRVHLTGDVFGPTQTSKRSVLNADDTVESSACVSVCD